MSDNGRQFSEQARVTAINPEDFLLKSSNSGQREQINPIQDFTIGKKGSSFNPGGSDFQVPYSNYLKNLVEQSGQPLLLDYVQNDQQQQQNSGPQYRPQPPIRTVGDQITYNYSPQVLDVYFYFDKMYHQCSRDSGFLSARRAINRRTLLCFLFSSSCSLIC